MPPWLSDVQGNVWPGFNKDHEAFLLVAFSGTESGPKWFRTVAPQIASAEEVAAFNALFKLVRARLGDDQRTLRVVSATWTNVAFTFAGLQRLLGPAALAQVPLAFRTNRVPFAESAADATDVHAMLILAADRSTDLDAELQRQRDVLRTTGVREVRTYRGATLPGRWRGREHFGFKDLVSQPVLVGTQPDPADADLTPDGDVVVGQPDADGGRRLAGGEWTRNGSFLAFIQLEQHVGTFWSTMQREAGRLGLGPEQLAERLVGRTRRGEDLSPQPPRLSHVGRAYPRWLPGGEADRHRIMRRGIPYGPPWEPGRPDDGEERGILFVAYQADLARQFEHIWTRWLNGADFPGPGAGSDPLVGQVPAGARSVAESTHGQDQRIAQLKLPHFVSPHYGGYFFSPALSQFAVLAGEPAPVRSTASGGRYE
ncbi:MAG: Dyp-type peroxidase [Chloroflexi bacterium]|nr:Dyp-type peroxidase [Chloroflexota bacterium]